MFVVWGSQIYMLAKKSMVNMRPPRVASMSICRNLWKHGDAGSQQPVVSAFVPACGPSVHTWTQRDAWNSCSWFGGSRTGALPLDKQAMLLREIALPVLWLFLFVIFLLPSLMCSCCFHHRDFVFVFCLFQVAPLKAKPTSTKVQQSPESVPPSL